MADDLTFDIHLDGKTYRAFSYFDRFVRTGSWKRPALFLAIFAALALVSFLAAASGKRGGWLLGGVLLGVGVLFPASFFLRQTQAVARQAERLGLVGGKARFAYTLALTENPRGLTVRTPAAEPLLFPWKKAHGVWEHKGALYIYVEPGKAYVLPQAQLQGREEAVRAALRAAVPAERYHTGGGWR